ncbi:MAG: hypothetical protein JST40_00370 [Armatimonadetes bacterium]|nr:hypothetical protein [Armatimonadota bacterium]
MTKPGLAALIICCAGCGFLGLATWKGLSASQEVTAEAQKWCQQTLAPAMRPWSPEKLNGMAAGPLQREAPPAKMRDLCLLFQNKLGDLEVLGSPIASGFSKVPVDGEQKPAVRLQYRAKFSKADATLDVRLLRDGQRWKLAGLQIDP